MTWLTPAPQGLFEKCQESAEVSPAPVQAARSEESRTVHQGLNRGRGWRVQRWRISYQEAQEPRPSSHILRAHSPGCAGGIFAWWVQTIESQPSLEWLLTSPLLFQNLIPPGEKTPESPDGCADLWEPEGLGPQLAIQLKLFVCIWHLSELLPWLQEVPSVVLPKRWWVLWILFHTR